MYQHSKTLIVVAGPTAVGKTKVALALASHFNTAILSADSRQCYKELPIGTAQPTTEELALIPHYFIASHSIVEDMNAGKYETYALDILNNFFTHHDFVILCGGTGLYIDALCNGIDEMPAVNKEIEMEIKNAFETNGLSWLQETIKQEDEAFWQQAEQQNPVRLIRALTFIRSNGHSILNYRNKEKKTRPFNIIKIGLELPREELYNRINQRVDIMLREGLLQEVEANYNNRHLKSLATVGYSEFYAYDHWPLTQNELAEAIDKVKQHSRNYAKRQLTWFKKDKEYKWFSPLELESIKNYLNNLSVQSND